jgi:hypothetical protein
MEQDKGDTGKRGGEQKGKVRFKEWWSDARPTSEGRNGGRLSLTAREPRNPFHRWVTRLSSCRPGGGMRKPANSLSTSVLFALLPAVSAPS